MLADYPPERENTRGARWNPPETPAIYTSIEREVAIAEAGFYLSLQPVTPQVKRTIYKLEVCLDSVVTLTQEDLRTVFKISEAEFNSSDHGACSVIGGAIEYQLNDGLLVPSARTIGLNLVIFPNRQRSSYRFTVLSSEILNVDK